MRQKTLIYNMGFLTQGEPMAKGKVKFFNSQKGFGFITPNEGGKDLFFHKNNVRSDPHSIREGTEVSYEQGMGQKGPEATDVTAE